MTPGTAISIHFPKLTVIPAPANWPMAIAFGGVPTGVPMPPMLAANGIERIIPARSRSASGRDAATGRTTAIIVAVVAVLDINIENVAVMSISPSMILVGLSPNGRSMILPIALSSWNRDAPIARKKPPSTSISTGSARAK